MFVVPYIKACGHNITVNLCSRKLKICVIHFLLLTGGINELGGETEQAKREGKFVRVGVQRLQGVALLYISRYTCHGMCLVHFDSAKSISTYVKQR
jgi:hypothetical protein